MKLFTTTQIQALDAYTVKNEPIASVELMERAADALFAELLGMYPFNTTSFCVLAGPGNNGGDALALVRKLHNASYDVHVYLYFVGELSADCDYNRKKILHETPELLTEYYNEFVVPELPAEAVIVDGLFGSGISRPLKGVYAQLVEWVNHQPNTVVSIDLPSGLNGDSYHHFTEPTIKADYTFSFQFPKIAFFFIENEPYVGRWSVLDIGLHQGGIDMTPSDYYYADTQMLNKWLKRRSRFSHKGNFGHLMIVAGSKGMAGASILAAKAALRSGVGVLTVHGPECNRNIVQTIAPEVIYEADRNEECISEFYHASKYDGVAIGSGIGTRTATIEMMRHFLNHLRDPAVFDADALNIMASHQSMLDKLPPGSILTPHVKEFVRMFGESKNSFERVQKAREMAAKYKVIIVMKGAFTKTVTPEGKVYFNSTGNPGMATAGSGDVLTGIIGALLAQGYAPENAAVLGVFLHGLSADLAMEHQSEESLMSGDIITGLGRAFNYLKGNV